VMRASPLGQYCSTSPVIGTTNVPPCGSRVIAGSRTVLGPPA
jgi:hypothetical protein